MVQTTITLKEETKKLLYKAKGRIQEKENKLITNEKTINIILKHYLKVKET